MGRFGRHRCRAPSVDGECDVITARQYGLNVYAAVNRRMAEACALLSWLASNAQELGIENFEIPDDGPLEPRHQVTAAAWEKAAHYLSTATGESTDDVPNSVGHWVDYVGRGVGLDRLEGEILRLCINYTVDGRVMELFDGMRGARNRSPSLTADSRVISVMLGAAREQTQQRLQPEARLQASGLLLVKCDSEILVLGRLMRLVHRGLPDGRDLEEQLLGGTPPPSLPWEAFGHLGPEAELAANVLSRAVAEREPGISILLYGQPGTGKTTFAAALAARAGVKLRPVGETDEIGNEPNRGERLFDLRLAHRLVAPGSAVLLFDEAEDLFGGWVLDGMPVRGSRVFTHRLLEQTAVPVIWTANDIRQISPAALRRMTLCIELRLPTLANRARLWRSMAGEAGVALTESEAATLARLIPTAPAVASSALRAARLAGGGAGAARLAVEGLARAVNGGRLLVPEPAMEEFDFALVNADSDLEALTGRLVRPGAPRAVSLLLSGPPGSGKSAFVRQLATRMGLPLVQKRASDLLDMYVGGTEKAIAAAFAEARDNNAFLVFDEADSLLLDRADAVRSWEVTQVNEMLTWMESHPLPFACTTNLPDRLDSASLRRFLVKVRFDWLRPGQARHAFATHFHCAPPQELDALGTLTPADFALVQRRAALAGAEGDPAALLRLLRQECESRVGGRQPIGFGHVGGP